MVVLRKKIMTKYNTFLTVFIISVIAMIVFLVFYMQAIFGVIRTVDEFRGDEPSPFLIFNTIFSPQVIISAIVLGLSSLTYRILGIVHVAKSKTAGDGEKALWIVGFILMGFITAIVFLVMAKGRKFVE
jgi:heme/copper-type cytochrome/quinol oxidase subunit 4